MNNGKNLGQPMLAVATIDQLKEVIKEVVNNALQAQRDTQVLPIENPEEEEIFYTREEVAEKFGVNVTTLWRWDKEGYLPALKAGRKVLYPSSTINRFIERNKGVLFQ